MDPADAYVRLYDVLIGCSGALLEQWWDEGERIVGEVSREVESAGHLPDALMPDPLIPTPRAWAVLRGLDIALRGGDPDIDTLAKRQFGYLRTRLKQSGRLNEATNGMLLFRRARAARPAARDTLDDFLHLLRVPADRSAHIHVKVVREVDDLTDPGLGGDSERQAPLQLAQLPLLAESNDIVWMLPDNSYHVRPKDHLVGHLSSALHALDASTAAIALLPEASLSDTLVAEWTRLLQTTKPPPHSRLTWLLIGTGPVTEFAAASACNRPPNRAVLLHRSGKVLLTQDKRFGFTFTHSQQEDYGIDLERTRTEYLAQGIETTLLESHYGRFGVLICEDVTRHAAQHDVISAGATHLFVPVFAAAMWNAGWQAKMATILAEEAGAKSAVSNGLAIHRFVPKGLPEAGTPVPTLLIIATPPGFDTDLERPKPADMVQAYADPSASTDARTDALTVRGPADW
jgi:predicted amidohydrolase